MNLDIQFPILQKVSAKREWTSFCPILNNDDLSWSQKMDQIQKIDKDKQYLSVIADIEYRIAEKNKIYKKQPQNFATNTYPRLNPTLEIFQVDWDNIAPFFALDYDEKSNISKPQHKPDSLLMLWIKPELNFESPKPPNMIASTNSDPPVLVKHADETDLFILKAIEEDIDPLQSWKDWNIAPVVFYQLVREKTAMGLILQPETKIQRQWNHVPAMKQFTTEFLQSEDFTIQWHITHTCDLHCKHCYDRSLRSNLNMDQANQILDDLFHFCRRMSVQGHVVLTGGNPYLHKDFFAIYQGAIDRDFSVSILGNPVPEKMIQKTMDIAEPGFYQVSLEGLQQNNDFIRGPGNFDAVISFLEILKKHDIFSMVMLTLTKQNMADILPLARFLENKVDAFNFNRLSQVGEGKNLLLPTKAEYENFLRSYLQEAEQKDHVILKDNLFNIILHENNLPLHDGCTGFGCGAAFNFVAILPDGEVHACRKFPSEIGNALEQSLYDIFYSPKALSYRDGPAECAGCAIRPLCGGCMAVTAGMNNDPLQTKDPYCFLKK